MNNILFMSDRITCNARSELYITDVSMQTQIILRQRSQTFLSVFMPTHNTYFYDDCRNTKTVWIQLMINISNNVKLNVSIMYTHPHAKITDGAKMTRLIIITNNIWILTKHTTSFHDEQNLREHPLRLERL
jgi:hypothetical protein